MATPHPEVAAAVEVVVDGKPRAVSGDVFFGLWKSILRETSKKFETAQLPRAGSWDIRGIAPSSHLNSSANLLK